MPPSRGTGVCRFCGCTQIAGCAVTDSYGYMTCCSWIDPDHTICSASTCIARVPLDYLIKLANLKWHTP